MHPVECIQHIELFRYNLKLKCYQGVAGNELKATPTVQHREHPRSARGYLKERRTRDMNQIWWRVYSLSGRRGQWQIWCAFISHLANTFHSSTDSGRIPRIPAGIDRNPTGINREYPYLKYILRFYFRNMFWNRGIDQNSIIFKNLTQ